MVFSCVLGTITHYSLPMDELVGITILNPSGLDAAAHGSPDMPRGIKGQAIEVDGRDSYIQVFYIIITIML